MARENKGGFRIEKEITIAIPHHHDNFKYLKQCVESVKLQTVYKKCDVVLYDDCSPNAHLLKDIRTIKGDKQVGVSNARNILLEQAKTKYIYFLDSDDMFVSISSLQDLYDNIGDADVIISDFYEELYDKTKTIRFFDRVCVHGKLYSVDYLKENNIWFPKDVNAHEDIYFNLQVLYNENTKVKYLEKPTLVWRYRENSITRNNNHRYMFTTYVEYMHQFINGLSKTKNIGDVDALLSAFISNSYLHAQAAIFQGYEEYAIEIKNFTEKYIKDNYDIFNKIPIDKRIYMFSKQIEVTLNKLGVVLFKDSIYDWLDDVSWGLQNGLITETRPKNNQ